MQHCFQGGFKAPVQHYFMKLHRQWRAAGDPLGQALRLGPQRPFLHQSVHQPDPVGLFRIDEFTRIGELPGLGDADLARQEICSPVRDGGADVDFRETEFSAMCRNNEVACKHKFAAGPNRVTLNCGNEREPRQTNEPRRFLQRLLPFAQLRGADSSGLNFVAVLFDFRNVMPGEKRPPFTRNDCAADGKVRVEDAHVLTEFLPGGNGHCVQLLRSIEDDPGDSAIALNLHGRRHCTLLLGCAAEAAVGIALAFFAY